MFKDSSTDLGTKRIYPNLIKKSHIKPHQKNLQLMRFKTTFVIRPFSGYHERERCDTIILQIHDMNNGHLIFMQDGTPLY